jgi:hypothetical protein
MARGVRTNATLLPTFSPSLQPQSLASYDPKTRRNTILTLDIVPNINPGSTFQQSLIPSDRYYALIGPAQATTDLPLWIQAGTSNVTLATWDGTQKQFFTRLAAAAGDAHVGAAANAPKMIHPNGPYGMAPDYAPKNSSVTAVAIKFTARFNANADYTVYGAGANNSTTANQFDLNTEHFFQVTRNAGNWELGTCDGATISQSAAAGADGSWHQFEVKWNSTNLRLYVDGTLLITKTTNMPSQPLKPAIAANGTTNTVDIFDYLVEWEA